jgi:hypothetical protein
MDNLIKSPIEKFQVNFNFSIDLLSGETISTKVVTCINSAVGTGNIFSITRAASTINVDRTGDTITLIPGGIVAGFAAKTLGAIRTELEGFGATLGSYVNLSDDFLGEVIADSVGAQSSPYTLIIYNEAGTIIDSEAIASPEVNLVIKAGTEGYEYSIQCIVTTSLGNSFQRDLLLMVQTVVDDAFSKQPSDAFLFDVDFTRRLGTGDTVASGAVLATKESDGTDVSATVAPSVEVITPKIGVHVAAGSDGKTYLLGVRATTVAGYVYEKNVRMSVQEI